MASQLLAPGPPRLCARFDGLRLPYVPLGVFPTPVEPLEALSRDVGAEVWVKRDDLSGAAYGGNKVRKLEMLLGEALARGRRRVVTFGAYGTHHGLATAIYGRRLGLTVELYLHPQPLTSHVLDDLILHQAFGARLHRLPSAGCIAPLSLFLQARLQPGQLIPPGGSSPRGTLGFVEAGLELAAQVAAGELPAPDIVFVPAGTCGTAVGLALGLELAGLRPRVVAVRVVPAVVTNRYACERLRRLTLRLLRAGGLRAPRPVPLELSLDPHELGPGYGVVTERARAALDRFGGAGLDLETTYTGKTAAALLRWARGPGRGRRLLFWHTLSSVDLGPALAAAEPARLPPAFHPALRAGGRLA